MSKKRTLKNLDSMPTKYLNEILSDHNHMGRNGIDYGPVIEEIREILHARDLIRYEKEYAKMQREQKKQFKAQATSHKTKYLRLKELYQLLKDNDLAQDNVELTDQAHQSRLNEERALIISEIQSIKAGKK